MAEKKIAIPKIDFELDREKIRLLLKTALVMDKERESQMLNKDVNIRQDVPESSSSKRKSVMSSCAGERTKTTTKKNKPPPSRSGRAREPKKTVIMAGPNPPPDMPEALKSEARELGGGAAQTQVRLILQKKVSVSDVERQQARLSLPGNQLGSEEFLDEGEMAQAMEGKSIPVTVIFLMEADLEVQRKELDLRRWNYNCSSSYVLVRGWPKLVQSLKLNSDHILQIWFFRDNNRRPCFALVKLPSDEPPSSTHTHTF